MSNAEHESKAQARAAATMAEAKQAAADAAAKRTIGYVIEAAAMLETAALAADAKLFAERPSEAERQRSEARLVAIRDAAAKAEALKTIQRGFIRSKAAEAAVAAFRDAATEAAAMGASEWGRIRNLPLFAQWAAVGASVDIANNDATTAAEMLDSIRAKWETGQ